eukprot:365199-Chlamydomonas_euryale.AAC.8
MPGVAPWEAGPHARRAPCEAWRHAGCGAMGGVAPWEAGPNGKRAPWRGSRPEPGTHPPSCASAAGLRIQATGQTCRRLADRTLNSASGSGDAAHEIHGMGDVKEADRVEARWGRGRGRGRRMGTRCYAMRAGGD